MLKTYKPVVLLLSLATVGISQAHAADNNSDDNENNGLGGKHVLLISIDGMHVLDYENCVNNKTCPWMASLGKNGVTYPRTSTSKPSDSFPGLMAIVTGGSPKSEIGRAHV